MCGHCGDVRDKIFGADLHCIPSEPREVSNFGGILGTLAFCIAPEWEDTTAERAFVVIEIRNKGRKA
jgi:hypothetical protein